jgi:anti-sigma B factor antagonist
MSACRRRRADGAAAHARAARLTSAPMPLLEIKQRPLRGAPCLALAGELDIAEVPRLEHALDGAIADSAGAFVVDLGELEFLDSSGIRVLLRARALLGREDRTLVLVCPHGPVRRAIELTGVSDLFTTYPTRDAAAAALVPLENCGSTSRSSSSKNSS